jgi:hypothetical protein
MSNWDPATGRVTVAPGTLTAVSSFFPKAATVVLGDVVPKAKTTNFRPRIAGAYRLTGNLVLRGGYGEFTENEGYGVAGLAEHQQPVFVDRDVYQLDHRRRGGALIPQAVSGEPFLPSIAGREHHGAAGEDGRRRDPPVQRPRWKARGAASGCASRISVRAAST